MLTRAPLTNNPTKGVITQFEQIRKVSRILIPPIIIVLRLSQSKGHIPNFILINTVFSKLKMTRERKEANAAPIIP
jgi:hypothetical protein